MHTVDYAYLSELYTESHQSYADTANLSGVPVGTVNRIMTTHPDNPSIINIAGIVAAYGGSLDDLMGIMHPPRPAPSDHPRGNCANCHALASSRDAYTHAYEELKQEAAKKDKWIRWLRNFSVAITVALISMSIVCLALLWSHLHK